MKVTKSFTDYKGRQEDLREQIRQKKIKKIRKETEQMINTQCKTREEEMCQKITEQLKSHWQEKESEWAEKIRQQKELLQQMEDKYKNMKQQENRKLIKLQKQLQEKQLETERHWSELTNTWAAEKVCRDINKKNFGKHKGATSCKGRGMESCCRGRKN